MVTDSVLCEQNVHVIRHGEVLNAARQHAALVLEETNKV